MTPPGPPTSPAGPAVMTSQRWLGVVAVVLFGIVGLALSRLGPGPAQTIVVVDRPAATLAELVARADAVVVGRITAVEEGRLRSAPADPGRVVRTQLAGLIVDEVTLGRAPDRLVLEEVVALGDGTPAWIGGLRPSRIGDAGLYLVVRGEATDQVGLLGAQGRLLLDQSASAFATPGGTDPLLADLARMSPQGLRQAIIAAGR